MIGVGGVIPVYICNWSPYLSQFQYHPEPMSFATKTFYLMQIAVYIATIGAGGCKYLDTVIAFNRICIYHIYSMYGILVRYHSKIHKGYSSFKKGGLLSIQRKEKQWVIIKEFKNLYYTSSYLLFLIVALIWMMLFDS